VPKVGHYSYRLIQGFAQEEILDRFGGNIALVGSIPCDPSFNVIMGPYTYMYIITSPYE